MPPAGRYSLRLQATHAFLLGASLQHEGGLDPENYARLVIAEAVLVPPGVFLGQLVDVIVGAAIRAQLLFDHPTHNDCSLGVFSVHDGDRDAWIAIDIVRLEPAFGGV